MNNKFSLFFLLLFSIHSMPLQAVSPNTPGILGMSALVLGSFLSSLGQKPEDLPARFLMALLGSSLVYYVSGRYTPHNKFASALKIKEKVEKNMLFRSRNESNAALYEILNMHTGDYPFLHAIKSLHNLFTDLQAASRNVCSAPADLQDDIIFEQQCKELAKQIEYLQYEIKICTKRIMRTVQWYNEVNNEEDNLYWGPLSSEYIDSVKWSIKLISPEASIKIHTYHTGDRQITSSRLSFKEAFFKSLVDLTA